MIEDTMMIQLHPTDEIMIALIADAVEDADVAIAVIIDLPITMMTIDRTINAVMIMITRSHTLKVNKMVMMATTEVLTKMIQVPNTTVRAHQEKSMDMMKAVIHQEMSITIADHQMITTILIVQHGRATTTAVHHEVVTITIPAEMTTMIHHLIAATRAATEEHQHLHRIEEIQSYSRLLHRKRVG